MPPKFVLITEIIRQKAINAPRLYVGNLPQAMEAIYSYLRENREECQFSLQELMDQITGEYVPDVRMTEAGRLHVDLQRVTVWDQSPVVQCTRCLGFGHGRKLCTAAEDLCGHCGGPHMRSDCPAHVVGDAPECKNCKTSRLEQNDHNAFDERCPVRIKWDALPRSSVAYC